MSRTFILLIVAAILAVGCTAGKGANESNGTNKSAPVKGEGQIVDVGGSIPVQGESSGDSGSGQGSGHDGITTSESGDEMTLNSTRDDGGPIESGGSIGMGK